MVAHQLREHNVCNTIHLTLGPKKELGRFFEELEEIREARNPLQITIHHLGGSLASGLQIHKTLCDWPNQVTGVLDCEMNSAATLVYLGCHRRKMSRTAQIGFHYPHWQVSMQIYEDEQLLAQNFRIAKKRLEEIYKIFFERAGMKPSTLRRMMREKTVLNPKEAERHGIAHEIFESIETA